MGIPKHKIENLLEGIHMHPVASKGSFPKTEENVIAIAKNFSRLEVINYFMSNPCKFLVQSESASFEQMLAAMGQVSNVEDFDISTATLFIDPFMAPEEQAKSPDCLIVNFSEAEDKIRIKEVIENFAQRVSSLNSLEKKIAMISDELMMNAIYTAPLEAKEMGISKPEKKNAELLVSLKGRYLVVACIDYWGSLSRDRFLNRLHECHQDPNVLAPREGDNFGAGIGCKMIMANSHCFFSLCKSGEKTLMGSVIDLESKTKDLKKLPIHFSLRYF